MLAWGGNRYRCLFVIGALLVLLAAAQAQVSTQYYNPPFNLFSPQDDVQVGKQAEAQAMQKLPILKNAQANSYLTQLGLKLAAHMPGPKFPYRFHIVQQKDINAFALPGGPVFVNSGAICAASDEAQLAGVVGHEESHVALRHSTSMASKQEAGSMVLGVLGGLLGGSAAGRVAELGTQIGANFLFLKYSRSMESQADALGAQVMNSAGYNPIKMAQFFEVLKQQGGQSTAQFLSDHPDPGNRMQAIEREIPTLSAHPTYVNDSAQFEQVKRMICSGGGGGTAQNSSRGLTAPANGRRGSASAPPASSNGWATANFQGIQVEYPAGWQAFGGGSSDQLTLAPSNGISGSGQQSNILIGAIISVFQGGQSGSLRSQAQALIDSMRQSNPQMRAAGSAQSVRVAGISGESVWLDNQNAQGQAERDHLFAFPRQDGSMLYFLFIAPSQEYNQYGSQFSHILNSVRIAG